MNYIQFLNTKIYECQNECQETRNEKSSIWLGKGGWVFFFSLFYYDTIKHDETVIRPTIHYTFIDLMYALLASCTILTHDQRDGRHREKD
jgi:hypothetical protein